MKLILKINDMEKIFPEIMNKIKEDSIEVKKEIELNNYKISKIKNERVKNILSIMNGVKIDFDFNVSFNKEFDLVNIDKDILIALYLKSDEIVLNFEETEDFLPDNYLAEKYNIEINYFVEQNYVTPGIINWEEITKEVKESWNSSLFFLDKMNDSNFLTENKQLIFEKIKEEPEFVKEAILKNKNMNFLEYCMDILSPVDILNYIKESQSHLAYFWNKKIKPMLDETNTELLIKREKEYINEEVEKYQEFIIQSGSNSYGSYNQDHWTLLDKMRDKLLRDLKKREKEIRENAKIKELQLKEIKDILNEDSIKITLLKGIFNSLKKEDFILFEKDILKYQEIREMVIKSGLGKNNAVTKKFVSSLSKEEFKDFLINSEKNMDNFFTSDSKRVFSNLITEEQLLETLKDNQFGTLKILDNVKTNNKELNDLLFKLNPKERFDDLSKKEITNEHIILYLNNGGYLNYVKEKVNIYAIDDIEVIKAIVAQDSTYLSSKKVNQEFKNNPDIIYTVLNNHKSLEHINLRKENIENLLSYWDDCLYFIKEDKSYTFYKLLPENIKNNKEIANNLITGAKNRNYIEDAFKLLTPIVLMDKKFNIDLVKDYPQITGLINKELWNDKEFVLTLFKEVENSNREKELKKNLPKEIRLFLETFNVHEKFYTFFNNYYLQKKLEEDLRNQPPKEKVKKLKI